jgi:glyoxylase-like metal-dependent hydrolase (beta-lactamase superfamily II)
VRVGEIEITPVLDGSFDLPASAMYTKPAGEWGPHQQFLNDDGTLTLDVGGFLVRSGDRLALVDTGFGPWAQGRLLSSLADAGVRPEEVTDLLFTHLHFDHIGWASEGERAVFPNAVVRFDEAACCPAKAVGSG